MKFSTALFLKSVMDKQEYYDRELKGLVFGELPKFGEVKKRISDWSNR